MNKRLGITYFIITLVFFVLLYRQDYLANIDLFLILIFFGFALVISIVSKLLYKNIRLKNLEPLDLCEVLSFHTDKDVFIIEDTFTEGQYKFTFNYLSIDNRYSTIVKSKNNLIRMYDFTGNGNYAIRKYKHGLKLERK
ncbi:MAG: hypothetical protein ACI9AR_000021 [Flavobacteriaceae bacterium]|jgi:hypothetical protein